MKTEFLVPDMTCGHCVQTVTKAVHALDAQAAVQISLDSHRVVVDGRPDREAIRAAIVDAGYTVEPA